MYTSDNGIYLDFSLCFLKSHAQLHPKPVTPGTIKAIIKTNILSLFSTE